MYANKKFMVDERNFELELSIHRYRVEFLC